VSPAVPQNAMRVRAVVTVACRRQARECLTLAARKQRKECAGQDFASGLCPLAHRTHKSGRKIPNPKNGSPVALRQVSRPLDSRRPRRLHSLLPGSEESKSRHRTGRQVVCCQKGWASADDELTPSRSFARPGSGRTKRGPPKLERGRSTNRLRKVVHSSKSRAFATCHTREKGGREKKVTTGWCSRCRR
jgi:hypothetical protein